MPDAVSTSDTTINATIHPIPVRSSSLMGDQYHTGIPPSDDRAVIYIVRVAVNEVKSWNWN